MIEQLQKLDKRQINLIGLSSSFLLLLAVALYLVLPQWKAYRLADSSLELLRANTVATGGLDQQLQSLQTEVDDLERTLNGDAANLPAKQMEAFVIGRLQTISWRNDITLVSVLPRKDTLVNQFKELEFDVALNGGYFEFADWLDDIANELGFVVVKRFEMSAGSAGRQTNSADELDVKLTVATYRGAG